MLICLNAEGVHCQRKVGTPGLMQSWIFLLEVFGTAVRRNTLI